MLGVSQKPVLAFKKHPTKCDKKRGAHGKVQGPQPERLRKPVPVDREGWPYLLCVGWIPVAIVMEVCLHANAVTVFRASALGSDPDGGRLWGTGDPRRWRLRTFGFPGSEHCST